MGLELLVELPQCLLPTDGILEIESLLFSIAIILCLLFLHLLYQVLDYLEEMIFMLLPLETGRYLRRRGGAAVIDSMWLIVDWWRDCAPNSANGLAFGLGAVKGDDLLSWDHCRFE